MLLAIRADIIAAGVRAASVAAGGAAVPPAVTADISAADAVTASVRAGKAIMPVTYPADFI
jgi:hypothetical protein